MTATDLYVRRLDSTDYRLKRHVVHDPASRGFARAVTVDQSTWNDKEIRVYDPRPNPNQPVGNCTTCSKCSQLNSVGNRVKGVILGMSLALDMYEWETANDPFPGAWKRDGSGQDTGSNGLTSCKAAERWGLGGEYRWLLGGADEVVQTIQDGEAVSIGARWDQRMFEKDSRGVISLGGGMAGGHQWLARGYVERWDCVAGLCWWGTWRHFLIRRTDLDELLADDGDAHTQKRLVLAA